ncbi:FAD binding domain-containing protein [Lacrimispora sp.]|uniref:FAD binding domain-containing protein n=1 Tax=Lacrimispora sp. TaxID=2719234 RepID=UPI0028606915|nr:FAD binding domain-containing protein [Lacrimispora sp.]MDR7812682.1 FAD binding domain-containing protein [Lacrimispora sp.]
MIPFDFDYYKPESMDEAFKYYQDLLINNKKPLYYGGGTEIISMARVGGIEFDSVIDLKGIPECSQLEVSGGKFRIGAAQTLTNIAEYNAYPLLSKTIKRIADHTIQGKITIGGNLAGTIKYREAALPLMISDCTLQVMTRSGLAELPFSKAFNGKLQLRKGEFLVSILIEENDLSYPYNHVKRTKQEKIDYPLITMVASKNNKAIKTAITGYGDYPIILSERIINHKLYNMEQKIKKIINLAHSDCKGDLSGSREYREFVLENMLQDMFHNFEKIG